MIDRAALEQTAPGVYYRVEVYLIRKALLLLPLLMLGCRAHHYVVVGDRTPLYAASDGDAVLARLPRYYHEAMDGAPGSGERVEVRYKGQRGFVPRSKVRLFDYLDPEFDGGAARDHAVRLALREATLANVGASWPRAVVAAIRRDEVIEGMTRRQVEVAWGWPVTVEQGALPGGERWIYVSRTTRTLRQYFSDPWGYPSLSYSRYLPAPGFGYSPWHHSWSPAWGREGWIDVRLPMTEERQVEFGPNGRVTGARVRRYVKDT